MDADDSHNYHTTSIITHIPGVCLPVECVLTFARRYVQYSGFRAIFQESLMTFAVTVIIGVVLSCSHSLFWYHKWECSDFPDVFHAMVLGKDWPAREVKIKAEWVEGFSYLACYAEQVVELACLVLPSGMVLGITWGSNPRHSVDISISHCIFWVRRCLLMSLLQ